MSHHGAYIRRFYLDPNLILPLLNVPEGTTIRTLRWQDDRESFCVILNMPEDEKWFWDRNEGPIPILPVTITVATSAVGGGQIVVEEPAHAANT